MRGALQFRFQTKVVPWVMPGPQGDLRDSALMPACATLKLLCHGCPNITNMTWKLSFCACNCSLSFIQKFIICGHLYSQMVWAFLYTHLKCIVMLCIVQYNRIQSFTVCIPDSKSQVFHLRALLAGRSHPVDVVLKVRWHVARL